MVGWFARRRFSPESSLSRRGRLRRRKEQGKGRREVV
jgi:hypothetical protein